MSQATPPMREFARRLVVFEAKGKPSAGQKHRETYIVCNKLAAHLVTLIGTAGFQALLVRAIALTSEEIPWVGKIKINSDGSIEKPASLDPDLAAKALVDDSTLLVAQLLSLLVVFIGERLTLQLVLEVWPKLPDNDQNFGTGENK